MSMCVDVKRHAVNFLIRCLTRKLIRSLCDFMSSGESVSRVLVVCLANQPGNCHLRCSSFCTFVFDFMSRKIIILFFAL